MRSARCPEVSAKLREPLRRKSFERIELSSDNVHQCIHAFYRANGPKRVAFFEPSDECTELVKNQLEPELARLMNDDEQQLVGMLRRGSQSLQREQLIECQIRWVCDLVAQNVATSSAAMSSTRIVSVV